MSKFLATLMTLASFGAATSNATPVSLTGPEQNLQQIVDGMTVGGSSGVNIGTDQQTLDEVFQIDSVFGQASSMIVIELAGYKGSNRFGIYDVADASNRVQLFAGADSAGATTNFGIDASGHVFHGTTDSGLLFTGQTFGLYLETPDGTWFSQSSLNTDSSDHVVGYQGVGNSIKTSNGGTATWGAGTWLFGWEDLRNSQSDHDYNDFVAFVGGVKSVSVPEPTSLALMGLALAGFGLFGRRRNVG